MQSTPPSIPTRADYLERAAECERLAKASVTEESRTILLNLAARWRSLAEQEEPPPDKG
jgi:hypothetical protein